MHSTRPTLIFAIADVSVIGRGIIALGCGITAYASFTGEMRQARLTTYGGQLGLNVALNAAADLLAMRR